MNGIYALDRSTVPTILPSVSPFRQEEIRRRSEYVRTHMTQSFVSCHSYLDRISSPDIDRDGYKSMMSTSKPRDDVGKMFDHLFFLSLSFLFY